MLESSSPRCVARASFLPYPADVVCSTLFHSNGFRTPRYTILVFLRVCSSPLLTSKRGDKVKTRTLDERRGRLIHVLLRQPPGTACFGRATFYTRLLSTGITLRPRRGNQRARSWSHLTRCPTSRCTPVIFDDMILSFFPVCRVTRSLSRIPILSESYVHTLYCELLLLSSTASTVRRLTARLHGCVRRIAKLPALPPPERCSACSCMRLLRPRCPLPYSVHCTNRTYVLRNLNPVTDRH